MTLRNAMITASALGGLDTSLDDLLAKKPDVTRARKKRKARARALTKLNMQKKEDSK